MSLQEAPTEIRILTLNCWGLKFIADFRRERLSEIGRQISLADPSPQIVGLQECWTQEDYLSIRKQTRHMLPYGKFYWSGIFGGGLAILSKWPIEESNMYRYPLNGRPTAFFRGDWFVGKGVACARIRMGPRREDVAEVFCTHLHAPYEREPHDSYICHRTAQAWEIAKLMRGAAEKGHLVVGLGDFNMIPLSLAHRLITTHAPVKDVWRELHPDSSLGPANNVKEKARGKPLPTADFNITENGATCDSALNTWRWSKPLQKRLQKGEDIVVQENTQDPRAKRLDYIFVGGDPSLNGGEWIVQDAKVGMTGRHPTLKCSLSDHYSVEATIVHATHTAAEISPEAAPNGKAVRLKGGPAKFKGAAEKISAQPSQKHLPLETYDEILAMVSIYKLREYRQRRLRLGHFGGSIVVSIACFVAIWWSPRNFVAFLLMLLSTLNFGGGIIQGLIGGLFVGSELRALKEFEWEITNVRNGIVDEQEG